ncbi:uncharacterized protein LOC133823019 isoform X3 [Humulus lupulus]|uniref:uncharacterized protein LOC133823019 isoform X3 n=1 Tax=Humulus lupulus TaxID=3486 RepID=UPI002B405E61|nr:uncharacterized protein LOC133823019 isoform X3 [Humulus lupulus]
MSDSNNECTKEHELANNTFENKVGGDNSEDEPKSLDKSDENDAPASDKHDENPMPSPLQEETVKKKYGGIMPKKPPLISKDHERAFFDSADWALGKQQGAQKPKGPLEALRPKLQPTPHHQNRSRRSAYSPADESELEDGHANTSSKEQTTLDHDDTSNIA